MQPSLHIHHPLAATHRPTHELTARSLRAQASLPLLRQPSRPAPTLRSRKIADTRFTNL